MRAVALIVVLGALGAGCLFSGSGLRSGDGSPPADGGADADGDADADSEGDAGGDADADVDVDAPADADGAEADVDADAPPTCFEGASGCDGDTIVDCTGGVLVPREACALGCDPGGPRCLELAPSNVDASVMTRASGDLVVIGLVSFDTSTCLAEDLGASPAHVEVVTLASGREACAIVAESVIVEIGATLRAVGTRPLLLLATGAITLRGTIDVSASGPTPGPGGAVPASPTSDTVPGCSGRMPACTELGGRDSGGGGGGHGGAGGAGGRPCGGAGGAPFGLPELLPLTPGCGGAQGQTGDGDGGGSGGGGGGALQLSSGTDIEIAAGGLVRAGGGGGSAGLLYSAGGGGGAGGGVLVEAPTVRVAGTVAAGGGGGGAGSEGGAGSDGPRDGSRAEGGGASTYGGAGGRGGGGADLDGEDGGGGEWNGGGGGGAAGRVRINTRSGAAELPGTVSPAASTGAFTEGIVTTL